MRRFRVEVGRVHGVTPGNLVGALTNEASLNSEDIGRIGIFDEFSTIDLPGEMQRDLFDLLKKVRVCGQRLQISLQDDEKKYDGVKKHRGKEYTGKKEYSGKKKYGGKKKFEMSEPKPKRVKDRHRKRDKGKK